MILPNFFRMEGVDWWMEYFGREVERDYDSSL